MDKKIYNPMKLAEDYYDYDCRHSKEMFMKIYNAIEQADLHNDIPYMIYFREELCEEAGWYIDVKDIVKIFKEALALIDKYPDSERTFYHKIKRDAIEPFLWTYEKFLNIIISSYNISAKEYQWYLNDFRKRWTQYGYSESEPYRMELEFCLEKGDTEGAEKSWQEYKKSPAKYYERGNYYITEVKYYLLNNETEKAEQVHNPQNMYIKCCLLEYYLANGSYKKAEETAYILEHSHSYKKEIMFFASFMCAYAYNRTGRGLRIYKKHWREWEEEINPRYKYYTFKNAACFFKILNEAKGIGMVKLKTGSPVLAVNDNNIYSTEMLYKYYYKEAEKLARRFDKRNGTDSYIRRLKITLENICNQK